MCHSKSFIDFNQFSAALIIGTIENNELFSNGAGKSSIFRAIEYVLFNQLDFPMERAIRDDMDFCKVTFDFIINDIEYRVVRKRSKKSSDLTFLQRTTADGDDAYHTADFDPLMDKDLIKKYWKDLSGSRVSDTERDLFKLIRLNPKSYRSTQHFIQNETAGLATTTPEKRKAILKDALNLIIYAKLEKIAKDKNNFLVKEIEKLSILFDTLGQPEEDIIKLSEQLSTTLDALLSAESLHKEEAAKLIDHTEKLRALNEELSNVASKSTDLISQKNLLLADKIKSENSFKEYHTKKSNIAKQATELVESLKTLKEEHKKLTSYDYSQISNLEQEIDVLKSKVAHQNASIKLTLEKYEDLKIPLPTGSSCKACRKSMTDIDRENHKKHINLEMQECQINIAESKKQLAELNTSVGKNQQMLSLLQTSKQRLEIVDSQILNKDKELAEKRELYNDYVTLWKKFEGDVKTTTAKLLEIDEQLTCSPSQETDNINVKIKNENSIIQDITNKTNSFNKEIAHHSANKAVLMHTLEQKNLDKIKYLDLKNKLEKLKEEQSIYPYTLQAFSTTGIPNLIIQNVLEDFQNEANTLLSQLNPKLQLSFSVEKTIEKTGDQADTLEINYFLNGKPRYHAQLSGAQQLAVTFSLKIGLAFVLQKIMGVNIKLLLLDEVDQSLDKATIDYYADIIKFFQKDFTVLAITHNDRLKDKFSHAILVEQDINMVSTAKVISIN